MKTYTVILIALTALFAAGCGTTIAKNLTATNDNWGIEILEITDGPNKIGGDDKTRGIRPPPGYRYIWLNVRIENGASIARSIDLEAFQLISGQTITGPWHVFMIPVLLVVANRTPTVEAKEKIERIMVFGFPVSKQLDSIQAPYVGNIFIPKQSGR